MKILLMLGAKDGVGVTQYVAQLAIAQKSQQKICVIDADVDHAGDLAYHLNADERVHTAAQLRAHLERLRAEALHGYLCLPSGVAALQMTLPDPAVMQALALQYDLLIIDGGHMPVAALAEWLPWATVVGLVFTAEPLVVRAQTRYRAQLREQGLPPQRVIGIVNHWSQDNPTARAALQSHWGDDALVWSAADIFERVLQFPSREFPLAHTTDAKITATDDRCRDVHRQLLHQFLEHSAHSPHDPTWNAEHLRAHTLTVLRQLLADMNLEWVQPPQREQLLQAVLSEALGLGPLEELMQDLSITEIMINGAGQIYVEKSGQLTPHVAKFSSEDQLYHIIERILAPLGRRVDESSPMVDARLADGSRVNIVLPPLVLNGPTITIRRFSPQQWTLDDLIKRDSLTTAMRDLLQQAIERRLNIVVSGGTGSGKTTLLNVLSSEISAAERIITIEDAAELRLSQPHVVRLESRPANLEGKGAVTIRELVKNALRMRPNRIIVGECRGAEALDMLQAMNTGHDGSLTTVHANSPRAALARLETLVMFAGMDLPARAIRDQILTAVNLIVQVSRMPDGARKIIHIAEVQGAQGDVITLQDLFVYRHNQWTASGFTPRFLEKCNLSS